MWLLLMLTLNGVLLTQGSSFPPNMFHGEDYNMFHEFLSQHDITALHLFSPGQRSLNIYYASAEAMSRQTRCENTQ